MNIHEILRRVGVGTKYNRLDFGTVICIPKDVLEGRIQNAGANVTQVPAR